MYLTKGEVNPLLLECTIRYAVERRQHEEALRQAHDEARRQEALLNQRNEALRKSEEKFARSFRGSPVAIAISTVTDGLSKRKQAERSLLVSEAHLRESEEIPLSSFLS